MLLEKELLHSYLLRHEVLDSLLHAAEVLLCLLVFLELFVAAQVFRECHLWAVHVVVRAHVAYNLIVCSWYVLHWLVNVCFREVEVAFLAWYVLQVLAVLS